MKKLSHELEKLSHYYDSEMIIDINMASVYEFIHKKTGKKYVYRQSMTDLKDFGPGMVKMLDELKSEIREYKINDLGL
jgi:hypothetical protein